MEIERNQLPQGNPKQQTALREILEAYDRRPVGWWAHAGKLYLAGKGWVNVQPRPPGLQVPESRVRGEWFDTYAATVTALQLREWSGPYSDLLAWGLQRLPGVELGQCRTEERQPWLGAAFDRRIVPDLLRPVIQAGGCERVKLVRGVGHTPTGQRGPVIYGVSSCGRWEWLAMGLYAKATGRAPFPPHLRRRKAGA